MAVPTIERLVRFVSKCCYEDLTGNKHIFRILEKPCWPQLPVQLNDDPLSLTPRVSIRTAAAYATRSDDRVGGATARLQRQAQNLSQGYFSDQNRPYVTLGDVCLDSQTLFCKTLGVKLPPKEHHVTIHEPELPAIEKSTKDHSKSASPVQPGSPGEDGAPCVGHREAAGLTAIRTQLRETTSRRAAMRAGQGYMDHLNLCQKAAAKDDSPSDSMNMVVQKLSSHHFLPTKDRKYTLAFDPKTMTLKIKPKENLALARKKRHFKQRIETIHDIITSLGNVKSKHLRRRNPFSPEEFKALQKPPAAIEGKHGSLSATMDSVIRASNTHSLEPTTSNSQGSSKASVYFRPQRRGIGGFGLNQPHKDTWEDMFVDGKAKTKRRPWKLQTIDRACSIRGGHVLDDIRRSSRLKGDAGLKMVVKQKQNFQSLQNTLVKQTQDKLSRHSRDRSATYNLKVTAMRDLHPLWEIKGREVAQISVNPQDNETLPEETEAWFVQLAKELEELGEPTLPMLWRLDQLKRFAFGEGLNFTNVKEKLCLLTVSLPIQDICNPVVRDAMRFVVEDIFSLPRDLVHQWLTFRNLNFDKEN